MTDDPLKPETPLSEDGERKQSDGAPALSNPKAAPPAESKTPEKTAKPAKQGETWVETIQTILIALLIAGVVRSFLFQPFNIPSESMKPTLLVGDFLFVSKYSYGYSRHSLPFSMPLIPGPGRIFFSSPKRGDVVVFKTPADNSTDLIKRVIGLPGDEIQMMHGVLFINGQAVPRKPIRPYASNDPLSGHEKTGMLYEETLPNGVKYTTLDLGETPQDDTDIYKVPPAHYFMMGDNRDNSSDSRFSIMERGVSYVPAENLVGKAQIFFFSIDLPKPAWQIWKWPLGIRFSRFFQVIH